MKGYRDGHAYLFCDTCYRSLAHEHITVTKGQRSLRIVDDGAEYGAGKSVPLEFHFCSERCRLDYLGSRSE